MKREHKTMFGNAPKDIRKQMCKPDLPRAIMDHEVKRPGSVVINGKQVRYEGP